VQAAELWPAWSQELAADSGQGNVRIADGTTVILNTIGSPGIDDANYKAIKEQLRCYQQPFEDIDPADIGWLNPDPVCRPLNALHIPGEHAVNAAMLLDQLAQAYEHAGGTVIAEMASRVEYSRGKVTGVVLTSGTTLAAGQVVLAAGVHCQGLIGTVPDAAAVIPPLISGVGVSLLVRTWDGTAPSSVIRTPNRSFACGLHLLPRAKGEIYLGATNITAPEPAEQPEIWAVQFLLDGGCRQIKRDLVGGTISKAQAGNRPVAVDGFPLLGEAGVAGLWMMTGTYRDGLHLSPLLAREIAARILGEQPGSDLQKFRPVRPPIQAARREKIVRDTVMHVMAFGYESGWYVPIPFPRMVEHQLEPAFERLADAIDPFVTPPPEVLNAARVHPGLITTLQAYYTASRALENGTHAAPQTPDGGHGGKSSAGAAVPPLTVGMTGI
jgi:glycine oxidase